MAILFIPILFGLPKIYAWTTPGDDPILQAKQWYLNSLGFIVRAVIYFAIWNLLAYFLNKCRKSRIRRAIPRSPAAWEL